jgi:hypothetical protein
MKPRLREVVMQEQDVLEFDDVTVEELTDVSGAATSGSFATVGTVGSPTGTFSTVGSLGSWGT